MGLTSNSTTAVTQKVPRSVLQQPSQLWNSALLEIVIGKSIQVSVMRTADIWAQGPNVTLLEKLNIKDSLEEEVVLVEVEEEGERGKDAHLISGSNVLKGKGRRWPGVGDGEVSGLSSTLPLSRHKRPSAPDQQPAAREKGKFSTPPQTHLIGNSALQVILVHTSL